MVDKNNTKVSTQEVYSRDSAVIKKRREKEREGKIEEKEIYKAIESVGNRWNTYGDLDIRR